MPVEFLMSITQEEKICPHSLELRFRSHNLNLDLLTLLLYKMMYSEGRLLSLFSLFLVMRCSLETGKKIKEISSAYALVR